MTTLTTTIDDGTYSVTHRAGSHEIHLRWVDQPTLIPLNRIDGVVELLVAIKLSVDAAERRKARCEE